MERHKYRRKFLYFTLSLLLAGTTVLAAGYRDTAGHWAREEIDRWSSYGILEGYDSERFGPDDPISRGQMAAIVDRVLQYTLTDSKTFPDVNAAAWYAEPIGKASAHGVLNGYNDGTMRPDNSITQEEAIVMLNRAFSVGTKEQAENYAAASDWAKPEVYGMADALTGIEFNPTRPITRAEMVKILDNLVSRLCREPGRTSGAKERYTVITSSETVLENAEISGNVIISEQVGDGDVTIRNSKINGSLIVCGGGSNTVKLDNCEVKSVSMERQTGYARLLTSGGTKIGSVQVETKAKLDLNAGTVSQIEMKAADAELTVGKQAKVDALTVEKNATVAVEGTVVSAHVADGAGQTAFTGKGKLEKVTDDSSAARVETAGTSVTTVSGTKTTGSSSSSGSSSSGGGGSSSGGSSSRPPVKPDPKPEEPDPSPENPNPVDPAPVPVPLAVDHVECNDNGILKVHFNRATDTELDAAAFEVICPRGSAPEIRRVETTDRIVYYIHTSQYKDNDYQLNVTLPDSTRIEKIFTVKLESARITIAYADRLDDATAKLTYNSDAAGSFFHTLDALTETVPNDKPHAVPVEPEEMTAAQVKAGTKTAMQSNSNELTVTGLEKDTGYALYYCTEDTQGRTSLVHKVLIPSTPKVEQTVGVESAEPFLERPGADEFYYGFTIKLTSPTQNPLPVSAFTASCPSGNASLDRAVTTDNQTYRVYMPSGTLIYKNNHYNIQITLEDGTRVEARCYVDFKSPQVRCYAFEWKDANTVVAFVSSDEAGTLYYKVQPTVEGIGTVDGKSPADVYATGQTVEIAAGDNLITLTGENMGGQYLCMAAERTNAAGQVNRQEYLDYKQIDQYVEPDTPEEDAPAIIKITVLNKGNQPSMRIYLNKDPQEVSFELMSVTGTNGKILSSAQYDEDSIYLSLTNQTSLSDGEHTLTAIINDKYVTFTFTA